MPKKYENKIEDAFYVKRGVAAPERTPHMTEEQVEQMLASNIAGHVCEYYQQGAQILCDVADFTHGKNIGTNQRLVGTTPEGKPILAAHGPILRSDGESA